MRVILRGGLVGACLLDLTTLIWGFAFGAFEEISRHSPGHQPIPVLAIAMVCATVAGVVGFVYGMPLGYAVQKWSPAGPAGKGYLQAGFIGAVAGLVGSVAMSRSFQIIPQATHYHVVLFFVVPATLFSLLAALAIRFFSQPRAQPRSNWAAVTSFISHRKHSVLIAAGAMLVVALPALAWWLHWRDLPAQKVPRLLHEFQNSPGRREISLRSLWARSPDAIQADLDALGASAVPALIDVLADLGEGFGRNLAARQLGKLRDLRAVEPLIQCLEERPVQVHDAFHALVEIKDPRAADPLLVCLQDDNYDIRSLAAHCVADIAGSRAFDPLVTILYDEEIKKLESERKQRMLYTDLRATAAAVLGRCGEARAFDVSLRILEDLEDDREVRAGAARVLGELGDRRAIPALTRAAEGPIAPGASPVVFDNLKREATRALETLDRK
jgi:hypothetical protein